MTYFGKEPEEYCPVCDKRVHAEFVDNGFGPYAIQAGPYHCISCGWVEGCPYKEDCIKEKCVSWNICKDNNYESDNNKR